MYLGAHTNGPPTNTSAFNKVLVVGNPEEVDDVVETINQKTTNTLALTTTPRYLVIYLQQDIKEAIQVVILFDPEKDPSIPARQRTEMKSMLDLTTTDLDTSEAHHILITNAKTDLTTLLIQDHPDTEIEVLRGPDIQTILMAINAEAIKAADKQVEA